MNRLVWKKFALAIVGLSWVLAASAGEIEVAQDTKRFVMKGKPIEEAKIKVGDAVRFRNEDAFFHNIFSLSDLKSFDLGSFPKGESRTVTFDKPGVVEIECAIHPLMQLRLEVQ